MNNFSDLKLVKKLILACDNESELDLLFKALFTHKEREDLPVRLEIFKRLIKGEPQRIISSELGVGIATITRGSKELKYNPKTKDFLKKKLSW
jgi:TrpR family trp operon transcriptional repressor